MGTDKALIEVRGRAMALVVAEALGGAGCEPVWCQGGDEVALSALGLDVVGDEQPGEGPLVATLSALRRAGEPYQLSPKQLLQQTLVSSGTMTNRIDRLVGRRFVRRSADPDDGRSVLVTLTDDGRIRVDAAITRLVDVEAEILRGLSRADRDRLAALLRKLSLSFDA